MANPNPGGEWIPVSANETEASIATTPGVQLCIRAAHVSASGNIGEYKYVVHDVPGKVLQREQPADILAAAAQGQISISYRKPPIEDFDHIEIAVGTNTDSSEAESVYEGRDVEWVSRKVYQPTSRYYVFLRAFDTSRNASDWTDGIEVRPRTLSDSTANVLHSYSGAPSPVDGETGDFYVELSSGVLWARSSSGWWNTRINVHAGGPAVYLIPVSGLSVRSGGVPSAGSLGVPIGPEIPPGSSATGRDGRRWLWSLGGQRFFLDGDTTPTVPVPVNLHDVDISRPPAGCGRIYNVPTWPPEPLSESREGIVGEPRPAYHIAVTDDGSVGDFVNGAWIQRPQRLKRFNRAGTIIKRRDTPDEWTWLDQEPVRFGNVYGDSQWIVISTNHGADSDGASYYGQAYIRNFRTRRWEKLYQLCVETGEPAPPRDLTITTADSLERVRITLAWRPPASTVAPGNYRYRLFRKVDFDSDGRRVVLMEGITSFRSVTEIHTVDPPARYYLEVRAEYGADGNSRWARTEGLIGLSCATDPAPLAPDLWFQSTTSNDRLPETLYNRVPGALGGSALSRVPEIHWQYPGSGTRPDYIALYGDRLFQIAPPAAGQIQGLTLDDPSSGSIHTRLLTAPPTAAEGRRVFAGGGTDRHPGIRAVYGMRAVSKCGIATYRWSPLVLKDVMKRSTESSSPTVIQPIPRPTDVTPDGTVAGTHHFQVTFAGHESIHAGRGNIGAWHEFLIAGWQKDRYANPVPVRYYAFRAAGTVSSLSQLGQRPVGGTSGRQRFRLIPNTNAFTLVVTGIPTDFDGWYSFSVRYAETLNYGNSLGTSLSPSYSDWQNIRFQERGTFVEPPEPTVGAVTGIAGNAAFPICDTWQFSWVEPVANPALNILAPNGYEWSITGATNRNGTSLLPRATAQTLNPGQHTLTVLAFNQTSNRYVPSTAVTYPFFVTTNCTCQIFPPENGRQIESGLAGVAIVQFDKPERGADPVGYAWTLTGPSDNYRGRF